MVNNQHVTPAPATPAEATAAPAPPREFSCEGCGYTLVAPTPGARCPECGKPAAESDPDRCSGSAWQRRAGVKTWLRTAFGVLFRPSRLAGNLRMARPAFGLAAINLSLAGSLLAVTPDRIRSWSEIIFPPGGVVPADGRAAWVLDAGTTFFEQAATGIGVLAGLSLLVASALWVRKRPDDARVHPWVVMQVAAHATPAWLIAGPIRFLVERFAHPLLELIGRETWARWEQTHPLVVESALRFLPLGSMWGMAAGLLLFCVRTSSGLRRRRYASLLRRGRAASNPRADH